MTGDDGSYKFVSVKSGCYKIAFETTPGFSFAQKDVGDIRYDSDVDCNGRTDWFNVGSCSNLTEIDCSVQRDVGKIAGSVFTDANCDGINGVTKTVPGATYCIEAEAMCKSSGLGTFSGSQAAGGKFVKLTCGTSGTLTQDFTGKSGTYDVTFRVQDENDGRSSVKLLIDGVLVEAVCLNRDNNGAGDDNGGFQDFVIKGVKINCGSDIKLVVAGDGGEYVRLDKITLQGQSTTVVVPEPPKAGVKIVLLDAAGKVVATTFTDANGNYKFDNVPTGQYKVMGVAPDGTHFTLKDAGGNDSIDSDVGSNGQSDLICVTKDSTTDIDLGLCTIDEGALTGRYFFDAGRDNVDNGDAGVSGKIVTLYAADGTTVVATTTTDANGNYSFLDVAAGNYVVGFQDSAAQNRSFVAANVGADDAIDSDVNPATGKTAAVTVVAGQTTKDVDAGVLENTGSLAGRYFFDAGRDNTDNGDAGVSGKIVTLYKADGTTVVATTTTDANGNYKFLNVVPGSYVVGFQDSAAQNRSFVGQDVGGNDAIDSDVNPATGKTAAVTVGAGQNVTDVDAGVLENTGSLAGRYFFDAGRDNTDNGDAGVSGKIVTLYKADGTTVVATTTTDANGNYTFATVIPGTYVVGFQDSAAENRGFVAQDIGGNDAIDSDANPATGKTGTVTVGAGQIVTDIDVGVYTLNKAPIAVDDAATTCADETKTFDLLGNDSDPDGNPISVVSISDADETVGVGGVLHLASGALVTLNADGSVTYDGIAAYAGLTIGQHATDSFSYTISDGAATASAKAEVEVCGAANTPDSIQERNFEGATASFTLQAFTNANGINGYTITLHSVNLPNDLDGDALTVADFGGPTINAAYCIDFSQDLTQKVVTSANLMVATEANALAAGVSAAGAANMDAVNWILNQDFTAQDNGDGNGKLFTDLEVQEAIWILMNGDTFLLNNPAYGAPFADNLNGVRDNGEKGTIENAHDIADLALAFGEGFVAEAGDILGLILDPTAPATQDQPMIIGVQFNTFAEECLCA